LGSFCEKQPVEVGRLFDQPEKALPWFVQVGTTLHHVAHAAAEDTLSNSSPFRSAIPFTGPLPSQNLFQISHSPRASVDCVGGRWRVQQRKNRLLIVFLIELGRAWDLSGQQQIRAALMVPPAVFQDRGLGEMQRPTNIGDAEPFFSCE
jgi:hypothetical protein